MSRAPLPAMLVDVDGVLTDQDARTDEEAIALLTELVGLGAPAALVTGRSRAWLELHILRHVQDAEHLSCAAEYGAVHAERLSAPWQVSGGFSVPPDLRAELRQRSLDADLAPFVEWDETKECMATVEARHGADGDATHRERTQWALDRYLDRARRLATPRGLNVLRATYAVDVTARDLTKRVGAAWAIARFTDRGADLSEIRVFGDSSGDLEMVDVARERGAGRVAFVWLGAGPAPDQAGADVISPGARFALGAREVFAQILAGARQG